MEIENCLSSLKSDSGAVFRTNVNLHIRWSGAILESKSDSSLSHISRNYEYFLRFYDHQFKKYWKVNTSNFDRCWWALNSIQYFLKVASKACKWHFLKTGW
jgi:hypothetical protein